MNSLFFVQPDIHYRVHRPAISLGSLWMSEGQTLSINLFKFRINNIAQSPDISTNWVFVLSIPAKYTWRYFLSAVHATFQPISSSIQTAMCLHPSTCCYWLRKIVNKWSMLSSTFVLLQVRHLLSV
jgi:hypothetical protein